MLALFVQHSSSLEKSDCKKQGERVLTPIQKEMKMCHSITCGIVGKKLKENAIKISPYCLHPLTLFSAEVASRAILSPALQKFVTPPKKTPVGFQWFGILQVSVFERLLLQWKAKIVKEVSVPASLTKQFLLVLASHTTFWMGWKWAEELQVRTVVLSQEELITVLKSLLPYQTYHSTRSVHF